MIHVYGMDLSGDCSYEQSLILYGFLPPERQERVRNAKREDVARKRLYAGAFLQYALSAETGIPMEYIAYIYGSQGKPEIDYQKLETLLKDGTINIEGKISYGFHFNLSHSGDYAVLAVSDSPVGIDIEHKKNRYEAVAKRCFCKEEYEDIMEGAVPQEQQMRFLQYWTMKEARIKCSGEGMSIPLNSFSVTRRENGISYTRDEEYWFAGRPFGEPPYYVSLCSREKGDVENFSKKEIHRVRIEEISLGKYIHFESGKKTDIG